MAIAALLFFCPISQSAQFEVSDSNYLICDKLRGESRCIAIRMTGQIVDGDADRLTHALKLSEDAGSRNAPARVAAIFLHSPGGSVTEAIKIGRVARANQLWTQVGLNDRCASSCVLVLAGGVARFPMGKVEIHSFYSPEVLGTGNFSSAEKIYKDAVDQVSVYLKDMRVTGALLDEMMQVPHYGSREVEHEDAKRLGLFGIDPVYAQIRPQPKSKGRNDEKPR